MVRHLDDSDVAANIRLSTAVMDVIGAALAAPSDRSSALPPESRSTTLLLSIKAFIERELPNPALTPSGIAAEHHISVRYLQKLFEAQGETVTGWIRRRRLERSRRDLLDPRLRARPVAAIGARWGFADATHFKPHLPHLLRHAAG